MKIQLNTLPLSLLAAASLAIGGCQSPGVEQTGSEYMPDMAHSIAKEANVYNDYYLNTWDEASVKPKYELAQPGLPVKGTVPRGWTGYELAGDAVGPVDLAAQFQALEEVTGQTGNNRTIATPINGHVPYYYPDTEPGRERAIADIRRNPFPITPDGLARGAELYNLFCAICHGENGGGNGWIYENGAYPAAPRNFLVQEWVDTSAGLYYHAIEYGKNVMGSYTDKVSYEERWQIIHHIRALQAEEFKKIYTEAANDLVPDESDPIALNPQLAALYEPYTREPIEVESQESDAPDIVGDGPRDNIQLGEVNPTLALDSIPDVQDVTAPVTETLPEGGND